MAIGPRAWPRRQTLATALNLALLTGGTVVAVLTSATEDWQPVGLVVTLFVFGIASELLSSRLPSPPLAVTAYVTSSAAIALAIVFLGAAPALAISIAGFLAHGARARTPRRDVLANYSVFAVTDGVLVELVMSDWQISYGEPAIAIVVMVVYLYMDVVSFSMLALDEWLAFGRSPRELGRAAIRTHLVVATPLMVLAGVTGYMYAETGLVNFVILVVIQVPFFALGGMLRRSYDRAEALTRQAERISELSASRSQLVGQILPAEERERRRLAEALHDDAMQNLLSTARTCRQARTRAKLSGRAGPSMRRSTTCVTRSSSRIRPS